MNFTKTIMTTASAALISSAAFAGSHMSMEMTIVSWGGAYSASQLKAYHEPYSAKTGVTILNDDSSSTAVAQRPSPLIMSRGTSASGGIQSKYFLKGIYSPNGTGCCFKY